MLRNKILYLVLAGYSVIFAILYNEYVTALIAAVILGMPFLMVFLLIGTAPFVDLKIQPMNKVIRHGDEITISFLLKNKSVLPVTNCKMFFSYRNVMAGEKKKEKSTFALDSRSEQFITCRIPANHCGILEFSCDAIRMYDYFRIFSFRKKYKESIKLTIYPRAYEVIEEFMPNPNAVILESDVFSKRRPGDDPSEVFSIREYQEGDRLHRVHWKLSSKKEQLMIKEFSLPVNCSIAILVDFCFVGTRVKNGAFMDAIMETVVSISNHLIQSDLIHYIVWYDKEHLECRREKVETWEAIYSVVEELYHVVPYKDKNIFLQNYDTEFGKEKMADLFYVGESFTEEIGSRIKSIQQSSLYVLCQQSKMEPEVFPHTKISVIETDNVGESLKRVVF